LIFLRHTIWERKHDVKFYAESYGPLDLHRPRIKYLEPTRLPFQRHLSISIALDIYAIWSNEVNIQRNPSPTHLMTTASFNSNLVNFRRRYRAGHSVSKYHSLVAQAQNSSPLGNSRRASNISRRDLANVHLQVAAPPIPSSRCLSVRVA
jgi:hypothetical protein